jgi:DNA-binding NarL/FixJ family response regulator
MDCGVSPLFLIQELAICCRMHMINVLIADDHDMVRSGIKQWLESEPDIRVVAETGRGADALQLVSVLKPNVLLIAMRLPDKNGHEVIRDIRGAGMVLPILAMSGYADERARLAFDAGANGFLYKGESREQFVDAIRWAALGKHGVWISKTEAAIQKHDDMAIARANLTRTDLKILALLHLSNSEIASNLFLSVGTVKNHVTCLYSKLGVNTRIAAHEWASEKGIAG